SSSGLISMPRV
nr:RecName: Full=Periviscerokinin-3; Short=MasDa-PVK-3 [Mastotermes darwiniensis]